MLACADTSVPVNNASSTSVSHQVSKEQPVHVVKDRRHVHRDGLVTLSEKCSCAFGISAVMDSCESKNCAAPLSILQ